MVDALLGNHPDVSGTGELLNLPERGWVGNQYCSCHARVLECPFWSRVRTVWLASNGGITVEEYVRLQTRLLRFRHWPRLLENYLERSPDFRAYAEATVALYRAIRTVSGRRIIVDSSKNARAVFALSFMPGVDLRVIHLVRDVRGVAWSQLKSFERNEREGLQVPIRSMAVWRSSLGWMLSNIEAAAVRRWVSRSQSLLVRYEDIVERGEETIARVSGLLGVDPAPLIRLLRGGQPLRIEHVGTGNRFRMRDTFSLVLDDEWRRRMTTGQQLCCLCSTGGLQSYFRRLSAVDSGCGRVGH